MVDSWRLFSRFIKATTLIMGLGSLSGCASSSQSVQNHKILSLLGPKECPSTFFDFEINQKAISSIDSEKTLSVLIIDTDFNDDPSGSFLCSAETVRVEPLITFKDPFMQERWKYFYADKVNNGGDNFHGTRVSSFVVNDSSVKQKTVVYRYSISTMGDFINETLCGLEDQPNAAMWLGQLQNKEHALGLEAAHKLKVDGVNISLVTPWRDMEQLPYFCQLMEDGTLITVAGGNNPDASQVSPGFGFFASKINKTRWPGRMLIAGMASAEGVTPITNQGNPAGHQKKYFFTMSGSVDFYGSSYASPALLGLFLEEKALDPSITPAMFFKMLRQRAVDVGHPGVDKVFGQGIIMTGDKFLDLSVATHPKPETAVEVSSAPTPISLGPLFPASVTVTKEGQEDMLSNGQYLQSYLPLQSITELLRTK